MDWKSFCDQFDPMTCVISVEKTPDGGYGMIRIVTGNQSYMDSIALAAGGVDVDSAQKKEFIPDCEYTTYIPKDLNFEDVCYRCAVLKQPIQNYVRATRYPFDINAFLMPLAYEEGNLAFCTYSQLILQKSDSNLMAMSISLETAMHVISACIRLQEDENFYDNMGEVIGDIRTLCGAEYCCALLMDQKARNCSVLGESKAPDSALEWMGTYLDDGFYDIAETWLDTISGSFCLVIQDGHDMDFIRESNPVWYESLKQAGIDTMVIFPLFSKGDFLGYLWVANFDTVDTERIKDTLELAAHFIASAISGNRFLRRQDPQGGNQKMDSIMAGLMDELSQHVSHLDAQADSMITAMASDYRSVYHVNLDKNDGVCYRSDPEDQDQSPQGVHFPYLERFTWYAENIVTEGYREGFLNFIDPENIRRSLESQPIIAYRYLARRDDREYYEMIRMAGVRRAADREDHMVHAIGLGFTEIDDEVRETMARNEALAEALEMAEEANRAKTAFLSSMSHEFRTPMNAIIGLDKLALEEKNLDSQTREHLEKLGENARHLLGLINDILDMSRIESGYLILAKEPFSFREMIEQVQRETAEQCADKGLSFSCSVIGPVDDSYVGDGQKLKEVLHNILSNAVKFTDAPGSVEMTVERTALFEEQSTLKFCVRDTGIGIDKAYIPRIFDAFSQEDSSRRNRYGGTGLGLAITKAIVDMMNGSISVDSEKGKGSEFTVTVTLKNCDQLKPEGEERAEACAADQAAQKPRAEMAGRRILLAEDVEVNAEILTDLLEMDDVTAEHAENGRIAVEMFAAHEPGYYDAILMDIRMPEMDGLEATASIRAMDQADAKAIPIIAMTANTFDEDVQLSLQSGMNAHLTKPVDVDRLIQTLGELIYEVEARK